MSPGPMLPSPALSHGELSVVPYFWVTKACPCRLANNVAGQYKRGAAMALHIGFGNFAGCKLRLDAKLMLI